jgi:MOSC domain-containing protein YiiM
MQTDTTLRVVSINVGSPKEVNWSGHNVLTGIYKFPVKGRVAVRVHNIEGDEQADLKNHGGAEQAVYVYPAENYAYWQDQLPNAELPWGTFGENLTVTGLSEDEVMIGDQFRIGSTEFIVTAPRTPCYKLANKLAGEDVIKRFLHSGLTGFYLAVLQEGEVAANDQIIRTKRSENSMSIREIAGLVRDPSNRQAMQRAVELEALAPRLCASFKRRLASKEDVD